MKFFSCDTPIFRDELLTKAEEAITDIFFDFGLRYDNEQVKYTSRAKTVDVTMGGDPFIYQMTVNYNHVATGVIPTAATDGNTYYWNPHFVLALSPLALRFIIFHEATHAIFNHSDRRGGRDPRLWNLAVDYITNFYVVEDLKHRSETGRGDRRVFTEPTLMIELGNHITLADYEKMYKDPVLLEKMLKQAHDMRDKKKRRLSEYEKAMKEKRKLTAEEDEKIIAEIKKGFVWNPNAKEKTGFFVDPNLPEDLRTPEQIYDYLFSKLPKCPSCGKIGVAHDKNGKIQKDPNKPKQEAKDPNQRQPGETPEEQEKKQAKGKQQQGDQGDESGGDSPGDSGNPGDQGQNGKSGKSGKGGQNGQSGQGGKGGKGNQPGESGHGDSHDDHEHGEDGECCDHDHDHGKGKQGNQQGQGQSGQGEGDSDCDDLGLEDETGAGNKPGKGKGQKGQGQKGQGQPGQGQGDGEGEDGEQGEGSGQGQGEGEGEGECNSDGFGCSDCKDSADLLGIGDLLDEHLDSEVSQQEMAERLSEAIKQSSKMAGHVPSGMEGELGELVKPVLTFKDAIRLVEKRAKDGGKKSDYTRFKKRPLISGNFIPKRKDFIFKAAILVDTSGSMSDQDIINGVSQLQNMHELNQGIIIPADADIYWDQAVKIGSVKAEELKKFKVVGRGGTMFNQFFTDYEEHVGEQDMLIIITDGYLYNEQMTDPKIPVIWIVTNNHSRFSPPFGKAFELNI